MLTEQQVKAIERKLFDLAEVYLETRNPEVKERNRGYCQGIAYMLEQIGYAVEWDNGKAYIAEA